MSGDIANLYIKVDSEGVVTASKDLAGLEQAAAKTERATRNVETATQSASMSFSKLAGSLGVAAIAYQVTMRLMAELNDLFHKGFKAVEDYQTGIASLAAMVTTFSKRQAGQDLAGQWKEALKYSTEMIPILENIAAKTLLSGQETTALANAFARSGVFLDATNQKQIEGFTSLSNALPLMTQGQAIMMQINQEIRGLMGGGNMANSMLLQTLKAVDPQIKEHLKTWREEGTVMEHIGDLLAGFGPATEILENQWQAVKSTIDTTVIQTLRGGMEPVYKDIIGLIKDMDGGLVENKGTISAGIVVAWNYVKNIVSIVFNIIAGLKPLLDPLVEVTKAIGYGWGGILAALNPISKIIGNIVSASIEFAKIIGNAVAALISIIGLQPKAAKVAIDEAITGYNKIKGLAKENKDLFFNGIADSITNYDNQVQKALKTGQGTGKANKYNFQPGGGGEDDTDKAATAAKKLREEWIKLKAELNFEKATAGMDDLDKKLAEIERDIAKMRTNPNADMKLIDEVELQRQTAAVKEFYDDYLQEQIKAKENFERQEKAKQESIAKGEREMLEIIKKQYDADGQLLRDKLQLYKDLQGFEDEYRQVQLDWIARIKNEEIKATGDVAAAEKKAAKERAQIEYNLFKTKTDYIANGFGQLQSTFASLASIYEEGSDAARQWEQAAKAMEIAQKAVAVVQAVGAIATQGLGDPYTAFARVAAMAATMGALLATIGEGIGGTSGASMQSAPAYKFSSSVLGAEAGTESESLRKSWELLENTYDMEYEKLTKIHNELKDLNDNITGLVTSIIRTGSIGSIPFEASDPQTFFGISGITPLGKVIFGGLNKFLKGIFGGAFAVGKTELWSSSSGIKIGGGRAGDIAAGAGVNARSYQEWTTRTTTDFWRKDSYDYNYREQALAQETENLFNSVFKNISEVLVELSTGLGQDVNRALNYVFSPATINLQNMSEEQISSTLNAYISAVGDTAVQALFGQVLKGYQELGEGLMETAVRLMVDKEIVLEVLQQTNNAYSGSTANAIALSEALIKLAGDLETLTDIASTYYDKFFTDEEKHLRLQEQLTIIFGEMGRALPATRQAYRDVVESLDLTTESGRQAYITLLKLAEGADTYYSTLEEMAKELTATALAMKDAFATTNDAISEQIRLASSAAATARSAATAYQGITEALQDAIDEIRGISSPSGASFRSLYATGMTGDREALAALPGAAKEYLESVKSQATSAAEYAVERGRVLVALESAKGVSIAQENWQEYQATLLETQVSVLEAIQQELAQPDPNTAILEQHTGLLEGLATLLGDQTGQIISGNATQDVIANLSGLDTSYSAEMLNALVSRELTQAESLENILIANNTTVSLLRQLVDLTTANAMERSLAEIKAAYNAIQSASSGLQTALGRDSAAAQDLATAQSAIGQMPTTLADVLSANAGVAYSSANYAPEREGTYSEYIERIPKEQLIEKLFGAALGSVITQTDYSYIATNYNDRWQGYGHYYLDENGILRVASGGTYHADLGQGWSAGGVTSSAGITASVQQNIWARQSAYTAAIAATEQAMKQVEAANQKLADAQAEYSALIARYQDTFGETPTFASGGSFPGGLRIVGENGPELEMTGPSHIVNASKTEALLNNNVVLIEELRALRSELKAGLYQTAKNTGQTARVLDRTLTKWDEIGLPAEATP